MAVLESYTRFVGYLESHLFSCHIREFTGMECPGCGMQTAFIALLKGDVMESLATHPGFIPFMATFLFTLIHLKMRFKAGPRVVLILFCLTVTLTIVNYIGRLAHLW